jgi:signal transduction histidine kinase
MTRTPIGASPAEASSTFPLARIGLTNPATRFRKIFPYIGTALVVIIAVAGYATIRGMATSRDWLGHTYEVKSELANIELNRAVLHEAAQTTAPSEEAAGRVRSAAEAIRGALARLKQLVQDNPAQQERFEQLEPVLERHTQQIESTQRNGAAPTGATQRSTPGASRDMENAPEDATIGRIIGDINAEETQLLGARQALWDREFQRNIGVLAFAVAACLLLLFTNMHLLREDARSSRVAAEHIRESADSYRALSARIIALQDSERRRIGRELHDSVGQSLAALLMNLEQLGGARAGAGAALISESRELVQRTAQEVRTLSHLLHPPLLDVVGFVAAATNYVQEFARRSGIEVKVNFPEGISMPSKEAELVLFRVLQEALTNVHRHAQATVVDVWLARHDHEVLLSIQDNGRGLPPGAIESFEGGMASGVGLAGMRERLAEFGGTLHVESSHSGTIVRASIPV